ncbi:MAG: DUF1801 domain-containing protein [Cellulomonadaceae bacterium]|nr:DUF1801 domain-containing protein [Cellulomonadaceae bacterium]
MGTSADVDRYMADLEHPLKAEIARLRAAILASDPTITEHVKWNAPSFRHGGADRVTFRLHPAPHLQVIFHRGATPTLSPAPALDDPTGLMSWLSPDRAVVDLSAPGAVDAHLQHVVSLVGRWVLV